MRTNSHTLNDFQRDGRVTAYTWRCNILLSNITVSFSRVALASRHNELLKRTWRSVYSSTIGTQYLRVRMCIAFAGSTARDIDYLLIFPRQGCTIVC
mmetsp:Transcript_39544/g.96025  ORF Transcript_39544/g.96025 Transcript_39544/m.96025 type:complete len:97 (-) Transcript_39544:39-329(-)